ncbi:ankyrin repeat domain-containing protein 53 isoform X2 [Trichomycterus rosablanca]|uniref:ankyrin repeat domain-containing protein 53 isoform X2 n=1 Tax=Trichomycterus rosablanca TaxID=2290929 RepID=UPI002F350074
MAGVSFRTSVRKLGPVRFVLKVPPAHDMFQAAMSGDDEWLHFSLKRAPSPIQPNEQGLTVLHVATLYGRLNCVKLLVESGTVDINVICPRGRRPIHMAVSPESKPNSYCCLTYLLKHGAQANVSTDEGVTPLHMAAAEGLIECVKVLVKIGADTHLQDARGHTPLDLARLWGHRDIFRFLKSAMWHRDKKTDMERCQELQNLKEKLIWMHRKSEDRKKLVREVIIKQNVSEWAERKGLSLIWSPLKGSFSLSHVDCQSTKSVKTKSIKKHNQSIPKKVWNISTNPSRPPPASISRPRSVSMGTNPEEAADEPDLRPCVTLGWFKDGCVNCIASWDGDPQPLPDLPLDVIQRGLFPSAFPSRISGPRQFQTSSVLDVPRRGCTKGPEASPWTEVAMHLAEQLQAGHY